MRNVAASFRSLDLCPVECIRHLAAVHFAGKLISLSALLSGVWWLWPKFTKPAITTDLVAGLLWLAIGTLAWIAAFNYGRQRYWGQRYWGQR